MPPLTQQLDEHGFPIPATFDDPSSPRRRSQWLGYAWQVGLVLVFIVLLAGWVFKSGLGEGFNDFIAKQLLARAEQKNDFGDFPGALADLERAAQWAPQEPLIVEKRAQLKLKTHDLDGSLDDYSQLIRLQPKRVAPYLGRSTVYQRLNRHREAVDDLTKVVTMVPGDPTALNNRAYARAIGGLELEGALADVERAINIIDNEVADELMGRFDPKRAQLRVAEVNGRKAAYLDTRGYIYFLQEKYEPALEDLEKAIDLSTTWENMVLSLLQAAPREQQAARQQLDHELSVMYHHRGQVLEKLGRHEEAKSDLDRGDKLGYNPAEGVF
jgi:tetratricopeptide (TPR) repeat protein